MLQTSQNLLMLETPQESLMLEPPQESLMLETPEKSLSSKDQLYSSSRHIICSSQSLRKAAMRQQLSGLINPMNNSDQGFLNDPYPMLARFRAEAPVWYCQETKYWVVSRYAEAHAILRDLTYEKQIQRWKHNPNAFLIDLVPHVKSLRTASRNWMLNLNPPDHTRVRSLVNKAFTPMVVQGLRPQIETIA